MSAAFVRLAKRRFELSLNEIGRLLLVSERTVRRWVSTAQEDRWEVPGPAAIVLDLLLSRTITLDQLRAARDRVSRRRRSSAS